MASYICVCTDSNNDLLLLAQGVNLPVNINDFKDGKILAVKNHNNPFLLFFISSKSKSDDWHMFEVEVLEENRDGHAIKVKIIKEDK